MVDLEYMFHLELMLKALITYKDIKRYLKLTNHLYILKEQ